MTHDLFEASLSVGPTWRGKRGENFSTSKLDHIFLSALADHRAFSIPNPTSDHLAVIVSNRVKSKFEDPMPTPFTFRSTAPLVDKEVAHDLARQVAVETCRKFIFPREDMLAGRLEEFRDSDHPNFLPHVDNFFLNRTDISPAKKFNWLAGQLSDKMEEMWKASNRWYNNALNQYIKRTKRQLRAADSHAGADAAREELLGALKLQAVMQEERAR